MISVEKARKLIKERTPRLPEEKRPVENCFFHVLAEDIHSPMSHPPFRQSAMDGYAIIHSDIKKEGTPLDLMGESAAGNTKNLPLSSGKAVRIFTGAPVPDTASAVVMQEQTSKAENKVVINTTKVKEGQNIRPVGEIIAKEEAVMEKGQLITPAAAGFLHSLGITDVRVYKKPQTGVIVTGNELIAPGKKLQYGEIYESNSITLLKALESRYFDKPKLYRVSDDYNETKAILKEAFENCEALIISGGISVGDYDFVEKALKELGTEEVFYKVKQKPGKPMFFGLNGQKPVFALPGNPASALICLYQYVLPGLRKMSGLENIFSGIKKVRALAGFKWKGGKSMFIRSVLSEEGVIPLQDQNSASLRSFAKANALIRLPEDKNSFEKGEILEVIQLFQEL